MAFTVHNAERTRGRGTAENVGAARHWSTARWTTTTRVTVKLLITRTLPFAHFILLHAFVVIVAVAFGVGVQTITLVHTYARRSMNDLGFTRESETHIDFCRSD